MSYLSKIIRNTVLLCCLSGGALAQITVTNTNNSGAGSLRDAVAQANANPGADDIVFDTPLIGTAITITSELLIIGASGNFTTIEGDIDGDKIPDITIQPNVGGAFSGIVVESANCVISYLNIQGFSSVGQAAILVDGVGAIDNKIYGNYLGIDITGNAPGVANYAGVYITNGATGTVIGDGTTSGTNSIGGNTFGIRITGTSDNTVIAGNNIGVGADGASVLGNLRGLDIATATGTKIGVSGQLANIISGNTNEAIRLNTAAGTLIVNNLVGTDQTGLLNKGNGTGIYIFNASDASQVGDGTVAGRNIIAASTQFGIEVEDSDNVTILGNYIGVGSDGSTALGNGISGPANVAISGTAANTQIGNGTVGGRNIISSAAGAGASGINIGSGPTYVYGNYIGTDATGTLDRGNSTAGIVLTGGSGEIGGNAAGQGNVISGNAFGIGVNAGGFDILGNFIGTDASGTSAIPNNDRGIRLSVGTGTNIGDGTPGGANFISGNTLDGILVENVSTTANSIYMNYIGVQADGVSPLGNGGNGILIESDANGNSITQNTIANNTNNGVEIGEVGFTGIINNAVSQNSIYNNSGQGILITNSAQGGVAPPVITSTTNGLITGTADPGATIEIFVDATDEAEQYLGFTTANGSGDWSLQVVVASISSGLTNISVSQTPGNNTSELANAPLSLPFITTWTTTDGQITIPTTGGGYNYDVVWTNLTNAGIGEGSITGQTGNYTITGLENGSTYQVVISGAFPQIYFNNTGDKDKILTVEQWGNISWGNMAFSFYGCTNLTVPATDAPDLSSVISLKQMFQGATSFNQSIDHWDVSTIVEFYGMFWDATSFNQPLNSWVLSSANDISHMFYGATSFNQPLNNWVTTGITEIKVMFKNATSFNQPVNNFDVSLVTDFAGTFEGATAFNQPLNNWQMGAAKTLALMFYNASAFDQPIGNWDVSNVTSMAYMFANATSFDNNLSPWDISQVIDMTDMLWQSGLSVDNYDNALIGWATLDAGESQIPTGIATFRAFGLSYCNSVAERQSLIDTYGWDITLDTQSNLCEPLTQANNITFSNITTSQMDVSWVNGNGSNRIVVTHAGSAVDADPSDVSTYTASAVFGSGSAIGTGNYVVYNGVGNTMTITGLTPGTTYHFRVYEYNGSAGNENYTIATATGNPANATTASPPPPFITTWQTTDGQITIPTTGAGYNYDITWANLTNIGVGDGAITGQTGNYTITGLSNGDTYQIEISGVFPRIYFDSNSEADKIRTVEQWGSIAWSSMNHAFAGCANLTIPASDAPDLSSVTDMSAMFFGAASLNQNLNSWNVSTVMNMQELFKNATLFNQPLSSWNVTNVTNMASMFESASAFNQPLPWDVGNVTRMDAMFSLATAFNQDIGSWNVGMVNDMNNMFSGATSFNQDIGAWDVGNVTNMNTMFYSTPFNQDIGGWNVGGVLTMREMFLDAGAFNRDLSTWDVKDVTDMRNMFDFANAFDQSLSAWDISSVTAMNGMLDNTNLSTANYDATIIGWSSLDAGETMIPSTITLGAANLTYCAAESARAALIASNSWTFTGDSKNCPPEPEIAFYQGTDNTGIAISSGQVAPVRFGHLNLAEDRDMMFAIENTGTAVLTINSITLSGTDFTVISPPTTVAAGGTENFTIRLSGATKGIYNTFITIDNDDIDEATYSFSATGTVGDLDPKVYWTDDFAFPAEDQINRSDLDGSNFQQYYSGFEPKISGIAIDTTNNMVFWTSATDATIKCARLNESGFSAYGTILDESGGSSRAFNGLAIDAAAQKIYFASEWTNEIRRVNFDGTGGEVLVSINGPKDIALDVAGGKMYYVVLNIATPELWRANLDGSNQQLLYSSGTTLFLGVDLDLENGNVYWTESAGGIGRADLDGSNNTIIASVNSPEGIALNVAEQKIYYVDTSTPAIRRINFDGTGDVVIQSGSNLFDPVHLALDPRFPAVPAPEINVYAGADNTGTVITDGQVAQVDIGNSPQGTDLDQVFAIENTGDAGLVVSNMSVSGTAYSVIGLASTIPPGGTQNFTLRLSGAVPGTFNATVTITSDDADEATFDFPVTGQITAPFNILSHVPISNVTDVAGNTNITLNFDQNVDGSTLNASNIIVSGEQTGLINGVFSGAGTSTITFNPSTDFKNGELIRVSVTTGVMSTTPSAMGANYGFSFVVQPLPAPESPVFFTEHEIIDNANAGGPLYIHNADIDGDGAIDMVVADEVGDELFWCKNDGNENFTKQSIDTPNFLSSAKTADVDGDGDMDIIASNDNFLALYENDGNENFVRRVISSSAYYSNELIALDIDADGDLDLAAVAGLFDEISWYENDGSEVFTEHNLTNTMNAPSGIYAADVDGDSNIDLVVSSFGELNWYQNDGAFNFTEIPISTSVGQIQQVHAMDIDGDGDIDLATCASANLNWFENTGAGVFTQHNLSTTISGTNDLELGDLDGDGDIDLLTTGYNGTGGYLIYFYENDGAETFLLRQYLTSSGNLKKLNLADIDGDGDLDVSLCAGSSGAKVSWWENTSNTLAPEIAVYQGPDNTGTAITDGQGTAVDIGSEDQGTDITQTFAIANEGNADLTISGINITGTAYVITGMPTTITAGSSATFDATLSGAMTGTFSEMITINSNDTDEGVFEFPITGEISGVNIVDDNTGDVIISNQDVNVGTTPLHVDIQKSFVIQNLSSTQELIIQSITVDNAAFEIVDAPGSVAAQGSAQFTIKLNARQAGTYTGTVSVTTNINNFSFTVTGEVISEGELPLNVYNVVTPNGDEKHAFFHIENVETYPDNVVSIFNRWGEKVYEVSGYNNVDKIFVGISDQGKTLDTGNYYFVIDKGNGEKAKTGFLLLKR